jgi:quinol monooxygenase YgiN
MLVFTAKVTVKNGLEDEFARIMGRAVLKIRQEPGNHAYIFHRSSDHPRTFMFYEQYTDQAAFEAHRAHLREMHINLDSYFEGAAEHEYYELLA